MPDLTAEERTLISRALEAFGLVDVRFEGRRVSAMLPEVRR
jgi:hypothetical protein